MIKKILEQKLKSIRLRPDTGQLIQETFLNKLNSLHSRFNTNHKSECPHFEDKLTEVLQSIDIEDLGQQLELFKLESKCDHPGPEWSHAYKTKVINFIIQHDTNTEDFSSHQTDVLDGPDIDNIFRSRRINLFQKQFLNYYVADGYTMNELADRYQVHKATIRQWLREIRSVLKEPSPDRSL